MAKPILSFSMLATGSMGFPFPPPPPPTPAKLSHFNQLNCLTARALDHHGAGVAQPIRLLQDRDALAPELGDPGIEVADPEPDVIVDVATRADERLFALPRIPGEQH